MDQINEAIASAINTFTIATDAVEETFGPPLQEFVERGTETVGRMVAPIAENPLVQYATHVPALKWVMAALGQVNGEKVQLDVEELRQKYPLETTDQLAQRIIADAAFKAGEIGFLTNALPPLALTMFAVDVAAVNVLQAEMIYRIAAIYGFSMDDPTRRGEVLAIWGLSMGGSSVLKSGLNLVETIPFVGTAIGIASNAALLYTLGYVACRFYQAKRETLERNDRS